MGLHIDKYTVRTTNSGPRKSSDTGDATPSPRKLKADEKEFTERTVTALQTASAVVLKEDHYCFFSDKH